MNIRKLLQKNMVFLGHGLELLFYWEDICLLVGEVKRLPILDHQIPK